MSIQKKVPDPIFVFRNPRTEVCSLSFMDEHTLFSGGLDGSITTWNMKTRRSIGRFNSHHATSICKHPAVQSLISCNKGLISQGRDGIINLWDYQSLGNSDISPLCSIATNCSSFVTSKAMILDKELKLESIVNDISPLKDNNTSVSLLSEQLKEYSLSNSIEVEEVKQVPKVLPCNKPLVVIPSENSERIDIWDLESGNIILSLDVVSGNKLGMAMSIEIIRKSEDYNDIFIAATFEDGSLFIWSVAQPNQPIICRKSCFNDPALCCTFSKNGRKGIIGGASEQIISLKFNENMNIINSTEITIPQKGISSIQIRPDNKIFATSGWDHRVRLFSMKSNKPLAILKYHSATVHSVAFNPISNIIASGSSDSHIAIWSIY